MLTLQQQINALQASLFLTQDKEEKLEIQSKIDKLRDKLWEITEAIDEDWEY